MHGASTQDAVVVAWRGGGRWLTYIWSVDQWVVGNQTALFTPGTGNQGGEGTDHGQQWYIEVWPSCQPARACKTPCRLGTISQLLSRSRSTCGDPVRMCWKSSMMRANGTTITTRACSTTRSMAPPLRMRSGLRRAPKCCSTCPGRPPRLQRTSPFPGSRFGTRH
eukprot:COSAG01_NODE_3990_length_5458_cov_2.452323_8_plen_165_part_00